MGSSIDEGVRALCFSELRIEPKAGHVPQIVADWTSHVESWIRPPGLLPADPALRRHAVLAAGQLRHGCWSSCKLPKDRERLKRAIRHSSFRVLAEQERKNGFVERSRNADQFFRKGGVGGFRQELSERAGGDARSTGTGPMLREQRYLDDQDRLLI